VNIKTTLKASVAAAALFAVAVPVAEAGTVSNGNGNSVTVSGQINKAWMYVDDGISESSAIVDNDNSGSRFRILGSGKVNEAVSVGTALEVEFQDNASNNFQVNDARGTGGATTLGQSGSAAQVQNSANGNTGFGHSTFNQRRMEAYIAHKQFGKLSIGQGPTASDGTAETSLTDAGMAVYSGATFFSDVNIRTQGQAANTFSSKKWGGEYTNFDGAGRQDRIRYDSPTFGGFQVAASAISGGAGDVALRYGGKFGGIQVKAAASYVNFSSLSDSGTSGVKDAEGQYTISAAAKHDSGLNIRGHYGNRERVASTRDDTKGYNVTLGYAASLTSVGTTAFAVGYNQIDNMNANDDEATFWEFGVVQHLKDAGTELYLGVNIAEHDDATTTQYEEILGVIAGTRIKF